MAQDGSLAKSKPNGKGKKGKDRGEESREIGISKALSKILRHDAEKEGLKLDEEGYGSVEWLLQWRRLKSLQCTFDDIKHAALNNAKQRFTMRSHPAISSPLDLKTSVDASNWFIRANQGHSLKTIDADALLTPITVEAGNVPEVVIHGTYYGTYESIINSKGLSPMGRNHIHFSTGLPKAVAEKGHFDKDPLVANTTKDEGDVTEDEDDAPKVIEVEPKSEDESVKSDEESASKAEVISGMRADAEVLFYIDIMSSLTAGTKWYLSSNGVVLTPGDDNGFITKDFWKRVVGRRQDVGVLWENGVKVGELPPNVKGRKAPSGKGPRGKLAGGKRGGRGGKGGRMRELDALGGGEGVNGE